MLPAAPAPGVSISGVTIYADRAADNREDNIWVFDVRAEKQLTFGSRVRLRLMFDAFNLTNSHASETITRTTGTSYLQAERDPGATHGARRLPFHLLSSTPVGELKGGALVAPPFSLVPESARVFRPDLPRL